MSNEDSNRIVWVDMAKGALILLVIWGHIALGGIRSSISNGAIASFYDFMPVYGVMFMPAFFIISGFCSHIDKPINVLFAKGIKTLIIPSFALTLICIAAQCLIINSKSPLIEYIYTIPIAGGSWFLTVLFLLNCSAVLFFLSLTRLLEEFCF